MPGLTPLKAGYHRCGSVETRVGAPCRRQVPDRFVFCKDHRPEKAYPTPEHLISEEQQWAAYRLRLAGVSLYDIGQRVGLSVQGAKIAAMRAQTALAPDFAEVKEARSLERGRLERLLVAWMPAASRIGGNQTRDDGTVVAVPGPSEKAAKIVLSIINSLVKLDGLAAPTKVEHSGPDGAPIPFHTMTREERVMWAESLAAEAGRRVLALEAENNTIEGEVVG